MTSAPDDIPDRCKKVWDAISDEPQTKQELAATLDLSSATIRDYLDEIQAAGHGVYADGYNRYHLPGDTAGDEQHNHDNHNCDYDTDADQDLQIPGLDDIEPEDGAEPKPSDLTDRELYIARELQTGATLPELCNDLDERESVVTQHLRDLKRQGWRVYIDESAAHISIEGDHALRSSEHKGTRTRKANRWWELRHNALVREFRTLEWPHALLDNTAGNEDWVLHLTDIHAGDRVRRDDGEVVYETEQIPDLIDYVTEKALTLADKHGSTYDTAHLLWGGDFITNEGIYSGQFENLDAWLDEQHDIMVEPLIRQLKAFDERFPTVQVVCQVGNHGRHRANGMSRQANADLILYKTIRNTVAAIREHAANSVLENVNFVIGEASNYRNFELRGGELRGHLRHGQDTKPQAATAAGKRDWRGWLLDHEFDIAAVGHYHISGRVPWDGPPIIYSGSPKPAGDYVESLGGRPDHETRDIATAFGVSDDGLTAVFPIDTRDYDGSDTQSPDLSEWQWGLQ